MARKTKSEKGVKPDPRGNGKWLAIIADPFQGGKRRKFSFHTRDDAKAAKSNVEAKVKLILADPTLVPSNVVDVVKYLASDKTAGFRHGKANTYDVDELTKLFLDQQRPRLSLPPDTPNSLSQKEFNLREWSLKQFTNWCANKRKDNSVLCLSEESLAGFRAYCDDRWESQETIRHVVSRVKMFILWAWELKYLNDLPRNLKSFSNVVQNEAQSNPMELKDFATIFAQASQQIQLCMLLALNCGYLQSDISKLEHWMIDWNKGEINRIREKIRKKSKTPQRSKLWKRTLAMLKEMATEPNADGTNPVIVSESGGKLVNPESNTDNVRRTFDRLLRKKPLKDIQGPKGKYSFRDIRSGGSTLIKNNYKPKGPRTKTNQELMDLYLAHKPPKMNRPYDAGDWKELFQATDWLGKQAEREIRAALEE